MRSVIAEASSTDYAAPVVRRLPLLPLPVIGLDPAPPAPSPRRVPRAEPRAVRLSITDRCDLACVYCRPHRRDGYLESERRLGVDGWATLVRGLVHKGVRRVRITGGEPLVHPQVVEIVRAVASIDGVEDVALTTNATRLSELAGPLRAAGLARINVSLDSLEGARFFRLTRGGRLDQVLEGLAAARAAGFEDLKLNTVVLGGENDHELAAITRFAWSIGATPRFLERMRVGEGARLTARIVPYEEMRARLSELLVDDEPAREADRGPARYVRARHGSGRVGFITGSSATFCDGCDRLRASSDGRLRACLAQNDSVDVATAIRAHDEAAIARGLEEAWAGKPDGSVFRGCNEESAASVDMRATGG